MLVQDLLSGALCGLKISVLEAFLATKRTFSVRKTLVLAGEALFR